MQHTYIALDLETTGLSATKDRILEIGAVMVENGEVTGTYETFVDNGVEIPEADPGADRHHRGYGGGKPGDEAGCGGLSGIFRREAAAGT